MRGLLWPRWDPCHSVSPWLCVCAWGTLSPPTSASVCKLHIAHAHRPERALPSQISSQEAAADFLSLDLMSISSSLAPALTSSLRPTLASQATLSYLGEDGGKPESLDSKTGPRSPWTTDGAICSSSS